MANVHYGTIGDIWKHLPLAEILAIETPTRYWESHAGSSHYVLTHSPERDYGIFYFAHAASQSELLSHAVYLHLLKRYESKAVRSTSISNSSTLSMFLSSIQPLIDYGAEKLRCIGLHPCCLSKKHNRAQLLVHLLLRPQGPLLDFFSVMGSFVTGSFRCRHLPLASRALVIPSRRPDLPKGCKTRLLVSITDSSARLQEYLIPQKFARK